MLGCTSDMARVCSGMNVLSTMFIQGRREFGGGPGKGFSGAFFRKLKKNNNNSPFFGECYNM